MEHRRRRTVQSSLGRIDLGEAKEQGVLVVDEEEQQAPEGPISRSWSEGSNINDVEQQREDARRQKREASHRATKVAAQRFEVLIGIGRLTRDVVIDNVTFSVRSLKSKELRDVMDRAATTTTNVGEALTIRNSTLAYAIYQIDDQEISSYIGSNKIADRLVLIDELEEMVVSKIWAEYSKMLDAHQERLNKDLGTEAEEVIENVKKS